MKADQPRLLQLGKMERQSSRRQPEPFSDLPDGKSSMSRLHQKAEDIEPGFLRECREGCQSVRFFHISNILDIWNFVKRSLCGGFLFHPTK